MLATLLLPVLAGTPFPVPTSAPTFQDDEVPPPSVLDGWAFLEELLARFAAEPYGLELTGAHVADRPPWVGPPLALPAELPPEVVGGRGIEVQQLRLVRVSGGADARIDADLILALHADDAVGGTLVLEHLLAHLRAQPEVQRLERPTTRPLPDGHGLLVDGPSLRLDLTGRPSQRASSEERFASLELAVRSLASREGSRVPGLEFLPRNRSDSRAYFGFRHDAASPARIDALQHLFARLEAVEPRLGTIELSLRPPKAEEGETAVPAGLWGWDAKVEVLDAAAERARMAPASALEGYHVLLDVLAAMGERGVAVEGAVPPRRYGDPAARSLGLDDAALASLGSSDARAIEVRAMKIERKIARGNRPETIVLELDLAFRGANTVSASGLYETLRKVLQAQPEFQSLNRRSSEPFGDDTGITVRGLQLELAVPAAAAAQTETLEAARYARRIAADQNVQVGRIDVDARQVDVARDRSEARFTIRPFGSDSGLDVLNVYNFAWSLEHDAPGYTVTGLVLVPTRGGGGWEFEVEVTTLGE